MSKPFTRLGLSVGAVAIAQLLSLNAAHAVPSDQLAWSSLDYKIKVYKDAVDSDLYWFIPKIRFEAKNGKTVLRPKTLSTGKVEYSVRIVPYFTKDLREMVAQNITNIRQQSQLQPVVAKQIGVSLPDFAYKFSSPSVTDYEYLDVPRLVRFQLDPEEAATFDEYYDSDLGVPVEFSIAYDGMVADKFYKIDISCKSMARELSTSFKPSVNSSGKKVKDVTAYLGADLESAFLNTVQNSVNGVSIVSSGDIPGMQAMLSRVMNLCFEPVDPYGSSYYPDSTYDSEYPTRRSDPDAGLPSTTDDGSLPTRTDPSRGDAIDDGFTPRGGFVGSGLLDRSASTMTAAVKEAKAIKALHDKLDLDKVLAVVPGPGDGDPTQAGDPTQTGDPGLLPSKYLKMRYAFKNTTLDKDNQAVVKNVSMKNSTSTTVIVDTLTSTERAAQKVLIQTIGEKKFTVAVKNTAVAPLRTGIKINDGEQYTINAEFTFNAVSTYSPWKPKQYGWDSSWAKVDGDLYYRLGSGDWAPVNRRTIITSDVTRGGGELQFYIDRGSIFNKIPEKLRKGNMVVGPVFTPDGITPTFTIQVSGRRIQVK